MVYIVTLSVDLSDEMYLLKRAQIAHLKANEPSIKVPSKYADFVDIFLSKLAVELSKHTGINNYAIKLMDDQELLYSLIYSLGSMELEMLKTYIENNLTSSFIGSFKFPAETPIFFDKKLDKSLRLYVNY